MKTLFVIVFIIFLSGCNQRQNTDQTKETEIVVGEPAEINALETEDLIIRVLVNNRLQFALASLASEKSVAPQIAEFSRMITDTHEQFQMDMATIAQAYEIKPPEGLTPEAVQTFERISALEGEEFQKEFLKFTVDTHENSLEKFRRLASGSGQPLIRGVLQSIQDNLQQHLEIAKNLQDEIIAGT